VGEKFLLVPAYPGCPGSKAVKRSLLFVVVHFERGIMQFVFCVEVRCVFVTGVIFQLLSERPEQEKAQLPSVTCF